MSVVYFLLLLGVLVAVHELGHFAAARLLGIRVLRFSLGFGPAIASLSTGETEYRLGVVPLGGYVRLLGEDPTEPVTPAERARSFSARPIWQRLIVVFAGPAANLLAPLIIYFFFYLGHTEVPAPIVGDVVPGGSAAAAGIAPGDRVLAIDGKPVRTWEEIESTVEANPEATLRFSLRRGSHELSTYVTPRRQVIRRRDGVEREQALIGIRQAPVPPRVGILDRDSPAGRAGLRTGDLLISVDGQAVGTWSELQRELARHPRRAPIAYLRPRQAAVGFAAISVGEAALADMVPDFVVGDDGQRSLETGLHSAEFFVARVVHGSPAARAGLREGDLLWALNGEPVSSWLRFEQALLAEPERTHTLTWKRARIGGGVETLTAEVRQERQRVRDEYGHFHDQILFGAETELRGGDPQMVPVDGRILYAAGHAWTHTWQTIGEVAGGFATIVSGRAPHETVGGPIMMYRIAAVTGEKGWDYFLLMIALISVNLGLINLLPIPVLDGGHLVMFALEGASRRQLSPRVRELALTVGLAVIVGITVLALKNDILRYVLERT